MNKKSEQKGTQDLKKLHSVVFDSTCADAYIQMAIDEGLLEVKDQSEFRRWKKVPTWIRQQVLEQVVLTPNVLTTIRLDPTDAKGALLDKGMIKSIDSPEIDSVRPYSFQKGIIDGMLRARGRIISKKTYKQRTDNFISSIREDTAYKRKHGKPSPDLLLVRHAIDRGLQPDTFLEYDYTPEEIDASFERQAHFEAFIEIDQCMYEFQAVATIARQIEALLKVPVYFPDTELISEQIRTTPDTEPDAVTVFRIVARGLGKLTYRDNLRASLALAEESPTQALRDQLGLWIKAINEGDILEMELLQKEIKNSTSKLAKLSYINTVGTLTTWLSVPVGICEFLLQLPPVLGITLGVCGKGSSFASYRLRKKYEWAMFGNT